MIEKLHEHPYSMEKGVPHMWGFPSAKEVMDKINEIIEHINNIDVIVRPAKDSDNCAQELKPKFKEGDWVVFDGECGKDALCIKGVDIERKMYLTTDNTYIDLTDEGKLRRWIIKDAFDGLLPKNKTFVDCLHQAGYPLPNRAGIKTLPLTNLEKYLSKKFNLSIDEVCNTAAEIYSVVSASEMLADEICEKLNKKKNEEGEV